MLLLLPEGVISKSSSFPELASVTPALLLYPPYQADLPGGWSVLNNDQDTCPRQEQRRFEVEKNLNSRFIQNSINAKILHLLTFIKVQIKIKVKIFLLESSFHPSQLISISCKITWKVNFYKWSPIVWSPPWQRWVTGNCKMLFWCSYMFFFG